MEAQRFPEDFDGIIAGAPANDWSNHFHWISCGTRGVDSDPAQRNPSREAARDSKGCDWPCATLLTA